MDTALPAYQNPAAPLEQRAAALVAQMTLSEKVAQMLHATPAIPRLGVPAYNWWNECLHGVARAGVATIFPQAIGLAATWNPALHFKIAQAISDEARAKYHEFQRRGIRNIYAGLTFWTPNINIFRDPRWGRGQETYGEDPYLTGRLGVAFVKGLQGDDPRYLKLAATAKHFAVHSGPELERHGFNAQVSALDLHATYLPAFEACVREARVEAVMGAYNRTNGEACCASPTLLQKILRETWNFQGHVVSDCWAICDIFRHHKIVATVEQAAALAVQAGCDLNCGEAYSALTEAVGLGLLSQAALDTAVTRLFLTRFKLGQFDPPEQVPYAHIPYTVNHCAAHQALALQAARESMVLLKNAGAVLPLPKTLTSLAVIGPNADNLPALIGNYHGTPAQALTPLAGLRQKLAPGARVYFAPGSCMAENLPTLSPIPSACLRPLAAAPLSTGLTGAYYAGPEIAGEPAFTRVDAQVNFNWQGLSPVTQQLGETFAVRWQGYLLPPQTGAYTLGVCGLTGYTLQLDGQVVATFKNMEHEPVTTAQTLELEGGRLYALQLDYLNGGIDPQVQLLWQIGATTDLAAEALAVARQAEAVVVVLGLTPYLEGEEMPVQVPGFSGGDRTAIALPAPQEQLLKQLQKLGKPLVLVLLNGSALGLPWAKKHVPAIVEAWYPGEAGGAAIADVLFGDYNPAGRLPVTFYKSEKDLPPFNDYAMANRTYRYFTGRPLFPFGYGLSYTTFEYSQLQISPAQAATSATITVTASVRNTGPRAGDEVAQLYLRRLKAAGPAPLRELAGFQRLHLQAGETAIVTFSLTPPQLARVTEQGDRVNEPGQFEITVGGGQPGYAETIKGKLTLK